IKRERRLVQKRLRQGGELLLGQHPAEEMLQTSKCNDDPFRLSGAPARKQNVKRIVALHGLAASLLPPGRESCRRLRSEQKRGAGDRADGVDAAVRQGRSDWHVCPSRF